MSEKLIDEMCEKVFTETGVAIPSSWGGIMLSVIRQNVHLVAEVCPECAGNPDNYTMSAYTGKWSCETCKGFGIIAKQERGEG